MVVITLFAAIVLIATASGAEIECGVSSVVRPLIINGGVVERGEHPWQVALYTTHEVTKEWTQVCGGTLIEPDLIVSAAHCMFHSSGSKLEPKDIRIGLGKIYRDFDAKEGGSIIASVKAIAIPESYVGDALSYALDIALLQLVEKVEYNDYIRPAYVDWDLSVNLTSGEKVQVTGWGKTDTNSEPSERLMSALLQYQDLVSCAQIMKSFITSDKFCAQSVDGSQVLKGDSGGGMTAVKNQKHFLIGIVSLGLENLSLFTDLHSHQHIGWLSQERSKLHYIPKPLSSLSKTSSCTDTFATKCNGTGWPDFKDKYIFSNPKLKVNWFRARDLCETFGLEFARITSESELKAFKDDYSAAEVTLGTIWIGGNDLATEGTFLWDTLPSTPVLFTKWAPGEPNNNNKEEHCIQFQTDFNYGYGWNDNKCEVPISFACQKP